MFFLNNTQRRVLKSKQKPEFCGQLFTKSHIALFKKNWFFEKIAKYHFHNQKGW